MKYLSIPHYRGLKEKYDEQKYGDGIFFTTDTHEIIANNATYGETINTWSIADGVLTLTMTSGKTLEITFDEATESVKGFLSAEDKKKINSLEGNFDKKVDKVPGKSLVDDTDIAKLSELPSNSDLNNKLDTKLDKSAVESTVTADSNNPVSSAAINTYVSNTVTAIKNNVTNGTWIPVKKGYADGSVVIGDIYNSALGNYSQAAGCNTEASGYCSYAEGARTNASGEYSHAEGFYTTAENDSSHAEGYSTHAKGNYSHAEGIGTYARGDASHAQGSRNFDDKSFIDMVGVGSNSNNTINASVIYVKRANNDLPDPTDPKNGYQYLLGIGGYRGQEIGNAKSVQEVITDLENNKVDKTDMITITNGEIDEMFN